MELENEINIIIEKLNEIKINYNKTSEEKLLDFENMIGECKASSLGSFILEEASAGDIFVVYYRPRSDTDFQIYEVKS